MKKIFFLTVLSFTGMLLLAQPGKKPQKQPPQADINKMMEEAMKAENMSPEELEQMKSIMKEVMPSMTGANAKFADYPEFSSNSGLIPKKDAARINAIPKKKLAQADISAYAGTLYTKLMTKGKAAEINLAKQVLAKTPKAKDVEAAAVLAMLQGHPEAALALSIKAVQLEPANTNYQNNMASLLTQYGYAEQAIPVLDKLRAQYPGNSTVLNNLSQAWLSLGQTDSARVLSGFAMRANGRHPEAAVCGGLMDELTGDPIKAGEKYDAAMEHAPNPFTEQMINNNGKGGELDYDKIRRSIAIYEYFPKGWIKTSVLTPSVGYYVQNHSVQNGYRIMKEKMDDKIEAMIEQLNHELDNLVDKGETEFVKVMAKETMKGLNFMSKPAVAVLRVLHAYGVKISLQYAEDAKTLAKKVDDFRNEYQKAVSKAKNCTAYDNAANKLMENVNPLVHQWYTERAEHYREWANAVVTWNWYVAGNPKNSVLIQDMGFVAFLQDLYASAMREQIVYGPSCKPAKDPDPANIAEPEIPNFGCPAVVSIPVGPEWQQLTAASADFNKNGYNMQKSGSPIPNVSIGFGTTGMIAQPGIAPFVKTANGSITPGKISPADDELTPIPHIPLEELTPLPDLRKSRYAKELLAKMMQGDCKNVRNSKDILKDQLDRMMKSVRELDAYEESVEQIKKFSEAVDKMEAEIEKKEQLKSALDKFKKAVDELDRYEEVQELKQKLDNFHKAAEAIEADAAGKAAMKEQLSRMMQLVDEMENAPAALKDIQQNGLQPSLSSGIQAPGTFTPQKDLFK